MPIGKNLEKNMILFTGLHRSQALLRPLCVLIFLIMPMAFTFSCATGSSDDKDECEDTAWETTTEYTYGIYLWIDSSLEYLKDGSAIRNAQSIDIAGTIYKTYCGGKTSGEFSFSGAYTDGNIELETPLAVPSLYTYKIDNDNDVLTVDYDVTIVSEVGNVFNLTALTGHRTFTGTYLRETVHSYTYWVPSMVSHYELRIPLYASQVEMDQ